MQCPYLSRTADAELRTNPNVYTPEFRKRGSNVQVYSSASYTLRFMATVSDVTDYAGIRSDSTVNCRLLRPGDAWTYEPPYERFNVELPDGSSAFFGRIERSGVTWDEGFQMFTVNSDIEETSTCRSDISPGYEFFHSDTMTAVKCAATIP